MPEATRRRAWKRRLTFGACVIVVLGLCAYVLSYPHAVKRQLESNGYLRADSSDIPAYIPVAWLVDNTPIRTPVFWWAKEIGMEKVVRDGSALRRGEMCKEFPGGLKVQYVPREYWPNDVGLGHY